MKEKRIYCERCVGEITNREDLVVAFQLLEIVPYHSSCYSKSLKGFQTLFVGNEPVNGPIGTLKAIIFFIIVLILLFNPTIRFLGVILLIPPGIRLYSWFKYERYLP